MTVEKTLPPGVRQGRRRRGRAGCRGDRRQCRGAEPDAVERRGGRQHRGDRRGGDHRDPERLPLTDGFIPSGVDNDLFHRLLGRAG